MISQRGLYLYALKELKPKRGPKFSSETEIALGSPIYKTSSKTFAFIGTTHRNADRSYQKLIDAVFKNLRPRALIIEVPKTKPGTRPNLMRFNLGRDKWSGAEYAINAAIENTIPIFGNDLSHELIFKKEMEHNKFYGFRLGIFWWFILVYNSIKASNKISNKDAYKRALDATINSFVSKNGDLRKYKVQFVALCKQHSSSQQVALQRILQYITDKYVEKKPLAEILSSGVNLHTPYPYMKKYRINKVNLYLEAHRNYSMLVEFTKVLKKYDCVLAVGGYGHVMELEKIIKTEINNKFGKCSVRRVAAFAN